MKSSNLQYLVIAPAWNEEALLELTIWPVFKQNT
jgi:hypothetical protein